MGETQEVLGGRQSEGQPARETPLVCSLPSTRTWVITMGYYGQFNQFPFMPNPNFMSVREQMLQHQLLQEQQQFEAWRACQAQLQP